jgi:hypothetical protein
MGLYDIRPCPCGSGLPSHWLCDARGIPCDRVCEKCEATKRAKYRPEIFTNASYQADEQIEEDE